jgi:predicted RNase H-like HicB family nuclease
MALKNFVLIFEHAEANSAGYAPDVPGCMATGKTRAECEQRFRETLAFHFEGLRRKGKPIPEPCGMAGEVAVLA